MQLISLLLLGLISALSVSTVSANSDYADEPGGYSQLVRHTFSDKTNSGTCADYYPDSSGVYSAIRSDGSAWTSPTFYLRETKPAGQSKGGTQLECFFAPQSRLFWGLTLRTSNPFGGYDNGMNKIGFMMSTGPGSGAAWGLHFYGASGGGRVISVFLQAGPIANNCHVPDTQGQCDGTSMVFLPNIDSSPVLEGVVHRVQVTMVRSTSSTSRDGTLRVVVDGIVRTYHTNVNFPEYDFISVQTNHTWDGQCATRNPAVGPTTPPNDCRTFDDYYDTDDWYVSGASSSGDTTPPSQVTGLGVSINGTSATLTWAAASDNVGVTEYLAEKCTPIGCSNWALSSTTSSLSTTISSLTAGVGYAFRVRAKDLAGNLGSYSATVTGTTSSEVERTLATDDFNRANGALGANWTGSYSGRPDLNIVSNAVRGTATTGDNLMTYTAISSPADQWAKVDVTTATGAGLYAGGVVLRTAASPLASYYMCRMQTNGWAGTMIERLVNGSYTLLASSAPATWAVGDTLKCTARSSTITLSRIRSGVETVMLTATDSTHATGKTGVITYADTVANFGFDNFSTGDWTVAAAAPTIASFTSDATGANVTWTGSPAYIRVQTYTATGIYSDVVEPIANFPGGRYTHTWELGITSGCVFAQDASHVQNSNPSDYQCGPITPAPPADTAPPVLSSLLPSGPLPQGTTSTTISVITDESSTCRYSTTDQTYASMPSTFSTANGTSHSATKSGLTNGSSYTVYVRCLDAAGNANASSGTIAFSVASAPAADTTPPSTVTGLSAVALSTSQIQAAWTDATDNVAVASYRLYACVGTGCSDYALVASPVGTSATIAGLIASTVYRLVVDAIDTSGNISAAHSSAYEVTTSANVDIVPPSTLMNLRESVAPTYNTASLTWDAGTDNVAISQAMLERCAGATCEDFQTIRSVSGTTLSDSTVQFGTTYRYRGKHRDTSGNVSTNYSSILSVVVPAPPVGVTAGVCPCKTH